MRIIKGDNFMKRRTLIKVLEKAGYSLLRNGGNHDIYGKGNKRIFIPRHREINDSLAKSILRDIDY